MRWNAGFARGWNMQAPAEKATDSAGHCRGLPTAARVIVTSQLPLKLWHAQFQDPSSARDSVSEAKTPLISTCP